MGNKKGLQFKSVIALSLTAAVLAACAPKASDQQNTTTQDTTTASQAIVGGTEVSSGSELTKSVVALYDVQGTALCTGSLLANNIVLTAAHCVADVQGAMIVLFDTKLGAQSEKRFVDKAAVSPYWDSNQNSSQNTGDVALVHFTGDVPAGYKPAQFLTNTSLLKNGAKVLLVGYGISNGTTGDGAGVLRSASVKIADAKFSTTEVKIDQTRGRGACHGDSGGPAYVVSSGTLYLWGVTSRGVNDPQNNCTTFSVYTNALVYQTWISETSAKLIGSSSTVASN